MSIHTQQFFSAVGCGYINIQNSTGESGRKVGELVEQHIQEARKELKDDKNKLQTEEYKENKS